MQVARDAMLRELGALSSHPSFAATRLRRARMVALLPILAAVSFLAWRAYRALAAIGFDITRATDDIVRLVREIFATPPRLMVGIACAVSILLTAALTIRASILRSAASDAHGEGTHLLRRRQERLGLQRHACGPAEWAGRRTRTVSRCYLRERALHDCSPSLCAAQHHVRVRALRRRWEQQLARDVLYSSTRGCNSARRGARRGRPLRCECCVGCCLPPRRLGERRRQKPTAQAGRGGMGREAGGVAGL